MLKIGSAGLLSLATARVAAQAAGTGTEPRDIGRKFFADGRVRPFAGNTVICHFDQQGPRSAPFDVLLDIYRAAPGRSYGRKVTMLPSSSYHMTILGGATDDARDPGRWPADVPATMPIAECNRIVGRRIKSANLPSRGPIRMKVDPRDTGYDGNTLRMPLVPWDDAEGARLDALRIALAGAIGIRIADSYRFHATLGYLIEPFDPGEERQALDDMAGWKRVLATRCPMIQFGGPEYCTFEDMFAFYRQFFI